MAKKKTKGKGKRKPKKPKFVYELEGTITITFEAEVEGKDSQDAHSKLMDAIQLDLHYFDKMAVGSLSETGSDVDVEDARIQEQERCAICGRKGTTIRGRLQSFIQSEIDEVIGYVDDQKLEAYELPYLDGTFICWHCVADEKASKKYRRFLQDCFPVGDLKGIREKIKEQILCKKKKK
jgi:hypothetical protein